MNKIGFLILIIIIQCIDTVAESDTAKSSEQTDRKTYVLVVGGISKEPQDKMAMTKAITELQKLLKDNPEVSDQTFTVLVGDDLLTNNTFGISTVKAVQRTINSIGSVSNENDRFIFYYIGQANTVAEKLRFNLPDTDMTHEQLAQWIKKIKSESMLIVLDCPGSGLAVKVMSGPDRIVICSCTTDQKYRTRLSEYFVPALTDSESDSNGDGKISVLEAFTTASKQIDDWYRRNKLLTTEIPVLEDNGDGRASKEPWRYKLDGADGLAASEFFLIRR